MNKAAILAASICSVLAASSASALSPFTVFFGSGSSALDAQARAILDNAVLSWRVNQADLLITGYADRRGSVQSNRRLSCARARAVRSYIVAKGVRADSILTEGWGEFMPIVETPDEVAEPHNRRVAVIFNAPGENRTLPANSYRC